MRLAAVLGLSRVEFDEGCWMILELVNFHEPPGDSCTDEWQLFVYEKICLDLA